MALRTPAFNDAKTYGAEWLRLENELNNQEGVQGAGDLKVTAAAGGGMRVDVAAGIGLVKGDSGVPGTGVSQGLYIAVNDAAIANAVTLAAAHATLPRIDMIVLRVRDSSDLGTGADDAFIDFVTGTATSGATLDNRTGAAALPNDCLLLADVLVPAASASVTAGNVRDRRRWTRGYFGRQNKGNGNAVNATTTLGAIDAAVLQQRAECSGAPVRVTLQTIGFNNTAGSGVATHCRIDGLALDGLVQMAQIASPAANQSFPVGFSYVCTPAAGSHVFTPVFAAITSGQATLWASSTMATQFVVEELVRQDTNNGIV